MEHAHYHQHFLIHFLTRDLFFSSLSLSLSSLLLSSSSSLLLLSGISLAPLLLVVLSIPCLSPTPLFPFVRLVQLSNSVIHPWQPTQPCFVVIVLQSVWVWSLAGFSIFFGQKLGSFFFSSFTFFLFEIFLMISF